MAGVLVESPVWRLEFHAETQDDLIRITELIADECRATAPEETGELRGSIHTTFAPGNGYIHVGTDHWAPVEYGSMDHIIRPRARFVTSDGVTGTYRGRGVLAFFWEKEGRWVYFRKVHHPGTPAQPFMRTALFQRRARW